MSRSNKTNRNQNSNKERNQNKELVGRSNAATREGDYTGNSKERKGPRYKWSTEIKDNDFAWYNHAPEALSKVATISWRESIGRPFTIAEGVHRYTPAVMVFDALFGPGVSTNMNDPINMSAKEVSTYMVSKLNRTPKDYDFQEPIIMVQAYAECAALYYELARALRAVSYFDMDNETVPEQLIAALHFDYNDLRTNYSRYLGMLLETRDMFKAFPIPGDFDIIKKRLFFMNHIFTDTNLTKAQFYVFRSTGYRTLDELAPTGSTLRYHNWPDHLETWESRIQILWNMFSLIKGSSDFTDIMSDIKSAYSDNLFTVDSIEEMGDLKEMVPHHVLTQIMNADIVGGPVVEADVTQDPSINSGAILYSPSIRTNVGAGATSSHIPYKACPWYPDYDRIINVTVPDPTVEDLVEATRLLVKGTWEIVGSDVNLRLISGGDMVITQAHTCWIDFHNNWVHLDYGTMLDYTDPAVLGKINLNSTFDYHPTLIAASRNGSSDDIAHYEYIQELDNITTVSQLVLSDINRVVTKSLWGVPRQI
jgi:hypothetical protein